MPTSISNQFGSDCQDCHTVNGWRQAIREIQDHRNRFPLDRSPRGRPVRVVPSRRGDGNVYRAEHGVRRLPSPRLPSRPAPWTTPPLVSRCNASNAIASISGPTRASITGRSPNSRSRALMPRSSADSATWAGCFKVLRTIASVVMQGTSPRRASPTTARRASRTLAKPVTPRTRGTARCSTIPRRQALR